MTTELAVVSERPDNISGRSDDLEIGRLSASRARMASEIGAAMAHELNGPVTALLLYVGDLEQKLDRFRFLDLEGDCGSMRRTAAHASQEAERISALIHRMSDFFEAPMPEHAAVIAARNAITWWSGAGDNACLDEKNSDRS